MESTRFWRIRGDLGIQRNVSKPFNEWSFPVLIGWEIKENGPMCEEQLQAMAADLTPEARERMVPVWREQFNLPIVLKMPASKD